VGGKEVIGPFALKIAPRQPAQLGIDGVDQTTPCGLVALTQGDQEPCDISPVLAQASLIRQSEVHETEFLALPQTGV
jgi:hypothetical protein